ncbi:heavy metal translocating P-type ATPase [Pseudogemmobacter faecipullorum]|uniref:Cadmium-translocating P-type ATPase n=1 Tax=Pseudogemmobacter faecipullorum TaxID=2755041 RepID=A0ABS8CKG5_9RHOB|nr:heavy metal translocating P-type ATPase [Pseudogemmobacter faecipullorum]MCB5409650.1 cadmium-translocating P-type ATPase [Pseudogemmobacter faecipullorum]
MSLAGSVMTPAVSACPACVIAPAAADLARVAPKARIMLSLPAAHCAECIRTVEKALERVEGVISARLNLTLKRVSVEAGPEIRPEALIAVLKTAGYEAHELDPGLLSATETDRQGRDLLMRMGVAFFSMMNVMLLSVAVWSGAEGATRDLFHWVSGAIALPTVAFASQPFFISAWAALKAGRLGMDFPISLAILLACAISIFETLQSGPHAYFDAAVMLTFFLLVGRYLDHRSRALARSAAQELAALEVPRAIVLEQGGEHLRPIAEVQSGDLVLVRPGGRMPVDGLVISGASELDRSLLTGETLPVAVAPGAMVSAGEVNLTGPLTLRVTAAGKDSSLHRMADLVAVAEAAKTRYTSLAERAAHAYSSIVHVLAAAAFTGWLIWSGGDLRLSVNIMAAVLIITCPCALGLAVPAVLTSASGRLFRKGLLIKDGTALERLATVDTVVFDKTGTLTMGRPEALDFDSQPLQAQEIAFALASGSSHPLAMALAQQARARGLSPAPLSHVREVPGYGIEGMWQGQRLRLGRAAWCGAEPGAQTATWLAIGEAAPFCFTFADALRPGAEALVAALKADGRQVVLLSGDTPVAVEALAARLQITDWAAAVLPAEKSARIEALKAAGAQVLMVGDGLNDTAALAAAQVSISPASALDAARSASDIVLLGQDLSPVADALRISRQSSRRIVENFRISALYNIIAVPLALFGLATPLAAALAMSLSSVTVSLNALRLK